MFSPSSLANLDGATRSSGFERRMAREAETSGKARRSQARAIGFERQNEAK
jgi:hypothetical protein